MLQCPLRGGMVFLNSTNHANSEDYHSPHLAPDYSSDARHTCQQGGTSHTSGVGVVFPWSLQVSTEPARNYSLWPPLAQDWSFPGLEDPGAKFPVRTPYT